MIGLVAKAQQPNRSAAGSVLPTERSSAPQGRQDDYSPLPTSGDDAGDVSAPALDVEKHNNELSDADTNQHWFKKVSGLHTVEEWVSNYKNHPAGWAALLMMHGIPEVTQRLRSTVDGLALYAALFMTLSFAAVFQPPDQMVNCPEEEVLSMCGIRKRIYFYSLFVGVEAHILCMLISLAFGKALNEAARDSDVYRMFSPSGNAYMATVKCKMCFVFGMFTNLISTICVLHVFVGLEIVIFSAVSLTACGLFYFQTASPLLTSAGIVEYWKNPPQEDQQETDPYDLSIAVEAFKKLAKHSTELRQRKGS